jgi:N-acetylglucosaminyl-diphospho-decaprenol L-rhamnosyltransferase
MHIAISIVGFKNSADIVACLEALSRSTYPVFEVVICENGGPAAYEALSAALPPHLPGGQKVSLILAPRNLGFGGGCNVCVRETPNADAWWFLNPDTKADAEALASMVRRLNAGDCDAVGCRLLQPNGKVYSYRGRWRAWLARAELIGLGEDSRRPMDPIDVEHSQTFLDGASMLVGRRFVDAVGPMREDYFLYVEEVEWYVRAKARGMRLGFSPEASVVHAQGSTTGARHRARDMPRMPVYLGERNKILLVRDCYERRLPIAMAASLVLIALGSARGGGWRHATNVGYPGGCRPADGVFARGRLV